MKRLGLARLAPLCGLAAVLLLGGGHWLALRRPSASAEGVAGAVNATDVAPDAPSSSRRIKTVAVNSHRALPSTAPDGTPRVAPALPPLGQALALDSGLPLASRLKLVHALDAAKLDDTQAAALLAFVVERRTPAGLSASELLALKNDILNLLSARPASAAPLVTALRAIHDDPAADPGLRDYALQFLAVLSPATGFESQWSAVQGRDPALAATALLQLLSFAREGKLPAVDQTRLAEAAARLAADATAPEPSRATALQVCGQLGHAEARPLAWDVARSRQAGMPLRIAAIATLGDLGRGDAEILDYLEQTAVGREKRLRVPAESALKKLSIN